MWVKTVYKKEFINYYLEKELKNAERIGYKTKKEDWNGWSYTLVYQTFYKNKNQSSISTIIQYRSSGSIILRYDEKNITRIELAPNSLAWGMYIGFWKTYKIKYRKKVYNLYIDEVETFVEKHPDAEYIG
jgi:hypothetical protein